MSVKTDYGAWASLVEAGTTRAIANLSQMTGQTIEVNSFRLKSIPIQEISSLVGGRR